MTVQKWSNAAVVFDVSQRAEIPDLQFKQKYDLKWRRRKWHSKDC